MKKIALLIIFVKIFILSVLAQPTVGLIQHSQGSTDDGYVLFAPMTSGNTYLIDKCGRYLHHWASSWFPGLSCSFLPDGTLLRTANTNNPVFGIGGRGGMIEKIDWNNNVIWSYQISDNIYCQHHDVKCMPNGNILVIAWEKKTAAQAIAAGSNPQILSSVLMSEKIFELQPIGTDSAAIVWEWDAWDHLIQDYDSTKPNFGDIAAHPELIDLNYRGNSVEQVDLIHFNSVDYNPQLDQILLSTLYYDEIWIIDHSTSTMQAASHSGGNSGKGGDLMYRWGNPYSYENGTLANKKLFGQHNAMWIEPGLPMENNIIVFNNGLGRPSGNYSTIDIIEPPVDTAGNYQFTVPYLPNNAIIRYIAPSPTDFFAKNLSSAQMLQNGHLLICQGQQGIFIEVDANANVVWRYINPIGPDGPVPQGSIPGNYQVFRCLFYQENYPGFSSFNVMPGNPLELNPLPFNCFLTTDTPEPFDVTSDIHIFPNPASTLLNILVDKPTRSVDLFDSYGRLVKGNIQSKELAVSGMDSGMYFVKVTFPDSTSTFKKILVIQ
jgi:hypothetical protein